MNPWDRLVMADGTVTPIEDIVQMALDARRYRWLRSAPSYEVESITWEVEGEADFDARIDAAMKAEQE